MMLITTEQFQFLISNKNHGKTLY